MYHDEFARKPARPARFGEDAMPALTLEVGGGLSLGLAASLNQPLSMLVLGLGGLLPVVTCCLSIAAHRANELLQGLTSTLAKPRASIVPSPHGMFSADRSMAASRRRRGVKSAR